jgi:hypothetical protein
MPWSYQIDGERHLVITTVWDTLTGAEVLEHRRQLEIDPGFNCDYFQLVDLTRVTEVRIDLATMWDLAEVSLFSSKSRRAFVAPNPLAFGMSHMFISARSLFGNVEQGRLVDAEQMRIFNDRDEALHWLGVAPLD